MVDGSQLAFELQSLHVFEKRSNTVLALDVPMLDRINYYPADKY